MKTVVPVKTKELLKLNGYISGVIAGHMLQDAIRKVDTAHTLKAGARMDFADAKTLITFRENAKLYAKLLKSLRNQCKCKRIGTGKSTKYYYLQSDVEKFIEDWKKPGEDNG